MTTSASARSGLRCSRLFRDGLSVLVENAGSTGWHSPMAGAYFGARPAGIMSNRESQEAGVWPTNRRRR